VTILDINSLHKQGFSKRKISEKLGIHRDTVTKYLNNPHPISSTSACPRKSKLDPFNTHIEAWLEEDNEYKATLIYEKLTKIGFTGSYEIVKRKVHEYKKRRFQIAYMRFETEPGLQAQVDYGEFHVEQPDGTIKKRYLFTMILGYSREPYVELTSNCTLPSFLESHTRAFEYFGGVPAEIIYDRMKNVYIGKFAGKTKFNSSLEALALHYNFKPKVAPAYAAWVKGKVERPYHFIREGFWRGYTYSCLETANRDLKAWLKEKSQRVHGTTHEVVAERFLREKPYLSPLPFLTFDASYRVTRTVYKDCTIRFEGNSYVVPHTLVGQMLTLRVKDKSIRIFNDNTLVVSYEIPKGRGCLIQDKKFYENLKKDRAMNARKYAHLRKAKGRAKQTISPAKPKYEMDVEIRSLSVYEQLAMAEAVV